MDIPGETIELRSVPFVFWELTSPRTWDFGYTTTFRLVDLTGDGILEVWVECAYGMAVISFQEGAFKEVCSAYVSVKAEDSEYIDLDNDGIYEIKIRDSISINRVPTASYPEWISFYEWNGNTYVLNNERFYANNDAFLSRLSGDYNHVLFHYGKHEEYSFYLGLVYFYRRNAALARAHLQWVVKNAKKQPYVHAAEDLLKKLPTH